MMTLLEIKRDRLSFYRPKRLPTQAPNGWPLGQLRVIVTLPERLVKSFQKSDQSRCGTDNSREQRSSSAEVVIV